MAAAKKIKGLKLDLKAFTKQLSEAKPVLADAEKQLADGNFAVALQTAGTIRAQLADGEKTIVDAIAALKN